MTTQSKPDIAAERETKVQCADCLAWIKRDESHACRQQIRRNQRKGKAR